MARKRKHKKKENYTFFLIGLLFSLGILSNLDSGFLTHLGVQFITLTAIGGLIFSSWMGFKIWLEHKEEQRLLQSGIVEIDQMKGDEFEKFLEIFFSQQGYKVTRTPYQGDYGVDLILIDKEGKKTAVQAKRYSGNVGNGAIQEVVAGKNHYKCQYACVITNSGFTKPAENLARSNNVDLWDREILIEKLLELKEKNNSELPLLDKA